MDGRRLVQTAMRSSVGSIGNETGQTECLGNINVECASLTGAVSVAGATHRLQM